MHSIMLVHFEILFKSIRYFVDILSLLEFNPMHVVSVAKSMLAE